jgi:fatty acid desaturase
VKKDGLNWSISVAVNWLVIAVTIALAYQLNHIAGYVLAVLIVGTRQHALAVLGHDGAHLHVTENRWINDAVTSCLCFWPLGVGLHGWRKFHFDHHRFVGTAADPELGIKNKYPRNWSPETNQLRQFFVDLLGLSALESTMLIRLAKPIRKADVLGPVALILACWTAVLLWADWRVLAIWHVASVTSFWAVFRLRAFSEHVGTTSTHKLSEPPLWKKLLYLPENTWRHWEHHKWPAVPTRHFKEESRFNDLAEQE